MKKFLLILTASAITLTATAATLSPDEALKAALGSSGRRNMASLSPRGFTLVHTVTGSRAYVFNNNAGGFLIAAGDDDMPALIGYSDNGAFDPSDIPPGLAEFLEAVASRGMLKPAARSPQRSAVPVLVSSRWNQDAPYNDDCPRINGNATYTGCMATAIAQVMYHWKKPAQGNGTFTYEWTDGQYTSYGNLSFNYTQHPFDWDNMIDNYGADGGTAAQRAAVANLMKGVGVACQMMYGTGASGAYDFIAAGGFTSSLGYDKSLRLAQRASYSADAWDNMVYAQLATGHPIVYTGVSEAGGHAFVCDGYEWNNGNYYHINWGWGGSCDGYYLLGNLEPAEHGIGGGVGAFNSSQTAMLGIKPDEGGAHIPVIYADGNFVPGQETVKRSNGSVSFSANGRYGFYNMDYVEIKAALGVKLVNAVSGETSHIRMTSTISCRPGYLFGASLECPASLFPSEGQYYIYPAFQCDGEWYDAMFSDADNRDYIFLTVDGDNMKFNCFYEEPFLRVFNVSLPQWPDNAIRVAENGTSAVTVSGNITNLIDNYDGEIYAVIGRGYPQTTLVATSDPLTVSLDADTPQDMTLTFNFKGLSADMEPGLLYIAKKVDGKWQLGNEPLNVTFTSDDDPVKAELSISNVIINDTPAEEGKTIISHHPELFVSADFTARLADWAGYWGIAHYSTDGQYIERLEQAIEIGRDETVNDHAGLGYAVELDHTSEALFTVFLTAEEEGAPIVETPRYKVRFTPASIETVGIDSTGETTYYTLQGVRVANPGPGTYIAVRNGRASKEVLK